MCTNDIASAVTWLFQKKKKKCFAASQCHKDDTSSWFVYELCTGRPVVKWFACLPHMFEAWVSRLVCCPLLPLTFRKRSCRVHERLEIGVTGVDVSVNVSLYAPCHWLWVWGRMRQGEMDSGADCACIVLGCKRGSWCVRGSWEQYFSEYTWVGVAV